MRGQAIAAVAGLRGFDANATVSAADARAFAAAGYRVAMRYIRRDGARPSDLTVDEIEDLFDCGIAVMPVQHVESESAWTPTDGKGTYYGDNAAASAHALGIVSGVTVWLDLEGVADGVDPEQVIRYCNAWYDRVAAGGFDPGIYIGWHCGLSPDQLYGQLKFARYWGAYNLDADQYPATCGVAMKQHAAKPGDAPAAIRYPIDTDTISGDALGRFPTLFAPANWR